MVAIMGRKQAAIAIEGDGVVGSDYGNKWVRQQLRRRKATMVFLLAQDASNQDGRGNDCGEREAVTR
ncbi:hypothetical protein B296_00006568 [Ensete ventricosum]|uniref:Uncharacterized protein n=1 Tax=Ensete ventricosum TaxID=4639 RepID=A0A426YVY8_ENSVE|nr:hypothetical protein B296_00006568 [Ensete ventricosum]